MGYARASTDSPIISFKNYNINIYPVPMYLRTIPTTPLLSAGSGFDSTYVKDPEIVKGANNNYYLFYSGFNGSFTSGVVPLGSNLSSPIVGTRTQLSYVGSPTDNGAPSAIFDGTDYYLYLQTSAGPGASIQVLKSTTAGSYTNFTLIGTAIAGGSSQWSNGVYDPCILKQAINGIYYLYFCATSSTFNTQGFTRSIGVATANSLAGPWTIKGQVKVMNNLDNTVFGVEAPNVIYNSSTKSFHMQITGGSLGQQELLLN